MIHLPAIELNPTSLLFVGGFLNFLVPLLLFGLQTQRENQARNEIRQAEEAEIPGEQSQIQQEMLERGLGSSSGFRNFVNEPRRRYDVSQRVARARDLLQTPTSNPLASMLGDLARRQGAFGAGGFGQPSFNPFNWFRRPQQIQMQEPEEGYWT